MKKSRHLWMFSCVASSVLLVATAVQADHILGGVEVIVEPAEDPGPGFKAGTIVLRTTDSSSRLVTFENLRIEGPLVQTWLSGPFGAPTAKGAPASGPTYAPEWVPFDSHVLIRDSDPNMVGGGAGGSYGGISEENDGSLGVIDGLPQASGFDPNSGLGSIAMSDPTDAFFLDTPFQSNELNLAYVVVPDSDVVVELTIGVLGEGIVNSGDPDGANWGFNGVAPLSLVVPEPASGLLALCSFIGLAAFRRRS